MAQKRTPEEILEEARKLIGVETDPLRARYPIEHEPIRRYCHAAWDDNPLFIDPEYARRSRYGEVLCPPLAIRAVTMLPGLPLDHPFPASQLARSRLPTLPPIPSPGELEINLGVEYEFFRPVLVGDHLSESGRYSEVSIKSVRMDPKAFFVVADRIYRNQRDEVVAISRTPILLHRSPEEVAADGGVVAPAGGIEREKTAPAGDSHPDPRPPGARPEGTRAGTPARHAEGAGAGSALALGAVPGYLGPFERRQRYWDDVEEGEALPAIGYPLTMRQMVLFVSATQAWSPVHYDREEARRRGYPDIFPGGMAIQSCFSRLLMDVCGESGSLRTFSLRLRRMNHPGVTMVVAGKVVDKYVHDGEYRANLEVWSETSRDGVTSTGRATVSLPKRATSSE